MLPLACAHQTRRLVLRRPSHDDLFFAQALYARPEMRPGADDLNAEPPARIARRFRGEIRHWQDYGFGRYLLERDHIPVGFAGLTLNGPVGGLNLSYHLHPDHWGLGLAHEAVSAILDAAGDIHGDTPVVAVVHPENQASLGVLRKTGFRACGTVRLGDADWRRHIRGDASQMPWPGMPPGAIAASGRDRSGVIPRRS
ncbi:GNAT family N-acetyltransferase [Martelella alba]|uniref:GNAT family N-acetyltransferase n=1 Tax=Martelella alba TaxID=2590451 RepID=A0A506UGL0_9HYPH|nr:GNAT family N-acetyltransferase [Martelella alba]TPW32525.1 GNAT family N-acetyltransferase [Martelella alba]